MRKITIKDIDYLVPVNPAKRKAMVMKNETCFLKQKRNALQKF